MRMARCFCQLVVCGMPQKISLRLAKIKRRNEKGARICKRQEFRLIVRREIAMNKPMATMIAAGMSPSDA